MSITVYSLTLGSHLPSVLGAIVKKVNGKSVRIHFTAIDYRGAGDSRMGLFLDKMRQNYPDNAEITYNPHTIMLSCLNFPEEYLIIDNLNLWISNLILKNNNIDSFHLDQILFELDFLKYQKKEILILNTETEFDLDVHTHLGKLYQHASKEANIKLLDICSSYQVIFGSRALELLK